MHIATRAGAVVAAMMLPLVATGQLAEPPAAPKPDGKYLFYLHGAGVEQNPTRANEDWRANARAFESLGYTVIAEARPSGTNVRDYAKKVADQVRDLTSKGVPPENIAVVGYSKGGLIALSSAAWLQEPKVRFVVLAGCGTDKRPEVRQAQLSAAPRYKGKMLSIYDAGDAEFGSCKPLFDAASAGVQGSEQRIETSLGHQAFGRPDAVWVKPAGEFLAAP